MQTVSRVKHTPVEMILLTFAGVAGTLYYLLDAYLWSPVGTLVFLVLVLIGDLLTGIAVAKHWGGSFESNKAWRWCWKSMFYVYVLGMAYNAGKLNVLIGNGNPEVTMFLSWLPWFVYGVIFFSNVASVLKNAVLLGWITGGLGDFIYRNFDTSKNK
jgi:hypothetical protein